MGHHQRSQTGVKWPGTQTVRRGWRGTGGAGLRFVKDPLGCVQETRCDGFASNTIPITNSAAHHARSQSFKFLPGGPRENIMIAALAFLFVVVGMQHVAQADDTKAAVEDMNGKANANAEKAKGEVKALTEEAKGNTMTGAMERAKGKTQSAGERSKGKAKELKAKTE